MRNSKELETLATWVNGKKRGGEGEKTNERFVVVVVVVVVVIVVVVFCCFLLINEGKVIE